MDVTAHRESGYSRPACNECQRRKQKCDREWPCDRCHKRKVADQCQYNTLSPSAKSAGTNAREKRGGSHDDQVGSRAATVDNSASDSGIEALAGLLFTTLGLEHQVKEREQKLDWVDVDSSPQLKRVLQLLPQRSCMDELINIFIHDINYHYYIIYPPVFLQDYHSWWERRTTNQQIGLQWTCLLAAVCACAIQHMDSELEKTVQLEMDLTSVELSEELHKATRGLAGLIPVSHCHLVNIQRLLHTCYWYKAEARYPEAWHVLNNAILEARELGFHKEPAAGLVPAFELEMRRRLWCLLDTWDWQISSGLGRPILIDRAECTAELPALTLENYTISPLLHMKMQAQLTREITPRFHSPKDIITPEQIQEYTRVVEDWARRFPPAYSVDNPDKSWDDVYPWVVPHRYYVFTMACLMILNPIRVYMVKSYNEDADMAELEIRAIGIRYSLKVMDVLRVWVTSLSHRDGRMHFIVFSLFDTAAMLCTAIIKNKAHNIPNQRDVYTAITDAVDMLRRLNEFSPTSKASHNILRRLVRRLPQPLMVAEESRNKRLKISPVSISRQMPTLAPAPEATYGIEKSGPTTTSIAVDYSHHGAGPQLIPQNDYVAAESIILTPDYTDSHAYSDQSALSTGSPNTYPSMENNVQASISNASDGGIYDTLVQPMVNVESQLPMGQPMVNIEPQLPMGQPIQEPFQGVGLDNMAEVDGGWEDITNADLGELGPIWGWHSSNLEFDVPQNAVLAPNQ